MSVIATLILPLSRRVIGSDSGWGIRTLLSRIRRFVFAAMRSVFRSMCGMWGHLRARRSFSSMSPRRMACPISRIRSSGAMPRRASCVRARAKCWRLSCVRPIFPPLMRRSPPMCSRRGPIGCVSARPRMRQKLSRGCGWSVCIRCRSRCSAHKVLSVCDGNPHWDGTRTVVERDTCI